MRSLNFKNFKFIQKKKKISPFLKNFHLTLEEPQKFLTTKFSNNLGKNVKNIFTGSWQVPKGTKA